MMARGSESSRAAGLLCSTAAALMLLSAGDVSAGYVLTGNWTQPRDARCKTVLDDGTKESSTLSSTSLAVSQSGTAVNALLFGILPFYGRAISSSATLVRCANNALGKVAVYVREAQATNSAPDGIMKATLYDVEPGSLGICKVTLLRTSTTDPGVTPCP
jgi:hypothetical protein